MGKLIRNGIEYGGGNGTDIFEVTQAEYDALVLAGTLVHNALYVITDAPNLNETAKQISYDGGTDTVWDKVESKADSATTYTKTQIDDKLSLTQSLRVQIVRGAESYKAVYQSSEGGLTNPYGILIFGYTVLSIASSIGSTYDLSALADIQGSSGFTLTSGVLKFGTDANRQWVCLMPRNIKLVKQT